MSTPVKTVPWALTEKEKQTLRLIVRGHDAKSAARSLGLSVHTINERLRDARRKMAVSSSREAARLLLEAEGGAPGLLSPDLSADMKIGEDARRSSVDQGAAPLDGARRTDRHPWMTMGVLFMTLALGFLAMAALLQGTAESPPVPATAQAAPDSDVLDTARTWLALIDAQRWDESYQATGAAFRKLNTAETWATVSKKLRVPLGAALSRTVISQENLPAPPYGYEVVKFRTQFANKADAVETVSLERESGGWRVVGVTIE